MSARSVESRVLEQVKNFNEKYYYLRSKASSLRAESRRTKLEYFSIQKNIFQFSLE